MCGAIGQIVFKYIPMYIYARFGRRNLIWLISERECDARDNGYVLFRYLRSNYPKLPIYYAINFTSMDYRRVKPLGNIIKWGSFRHYYYYFSSSILAGSGFDICAPNLYVYLIMRHLLPTGAKKVFLQHGITKDFMPQALKKNLKANIFICGAYPEFVYISRNFGYSAEEVVYTGFARYDLLENTCATNQILYMPTWRLWLGNNLLESSDFFLYVSSLLSNKELHSFLEVTDTEFIFFLHPAIRTMKEHFKRFETNHIRVMNNDDVDLQTLLKSACLLITDYSSVYFDFAYLNKPVLYYQFDYDRYRKEHYSVGYFDYEENGFGPVLHIENEIISHIWTLNRNFWKNPLLYNMRAKLFFKLRDHNNCQRIYEVLKGIEQKH
jgi:CDP-glycerol glycerophosphotransferase (TagB/SpsB family)